MKRHDLPPGARNVFIIILIAVINLGLGFALAVYLNKRYRQLTSEAGPTSTASPKRLPI